MNEEKQVPKKLKLAQDLAEQGYDDVLVLTRESANKVLTEKRTELLNVIENEDVESVRELARKVDRDPSRVSKDLKILSESNLVTFNDGKGDRKVPEMRHENVFIEPVVMKSA